MVWSQPPVVEQSDKGSPGPWGHRWDNPLGGALPSGPPPCPRWPWTTEPSPSPVPRPRLLFWRRVTPRPGGAMGWRGVHVAGSILGFPKKSGRGCYPTLTRGWGVFTWASSCQSEFIHCFVHDFSQVWKKTIWQQHWKCKSNNTPNWEL